MTHDEIDALPAGRELDTLVAEWVMGLMPCDQWKAVEWDGDVGAACMIHDGGCYAVGIRESCEHVEKYENPMALPIRTAESCHWSSRRFLGPSLYSTDIAAAWLVVEKLRERCVQISMIWAPANPAKNCREGWSCAPWLEEPAAGTMFSVPISETAPLAICRAALKAVSA